MTTRATKIEPLKALVLEDLTEEGATTVTGGRKPARLRGEVVTNNLGPTNRQKKHVARMSVESLTFE